jgi:hypothetical protein
VRPPAVRMGTTGTRSEFAPSANRFGYSNSSPASIGMKLVVPAIDALAVNPVEHLSRFQPPFCPWQGCAEHRRCQPGYRFRRHRFFSAAQRLRIPRLRCRACKRTFSRQTFAVSCYRKRPELLRPDRATRELATTLLRGLDHPAARIQRQTPPAQSFLNRSPPNTSRIPDSTSAPDHNLGDTLDFYSPAATGKAPFTLIIPACCIVCRWPASWDSCSLRRS